MRIKSAKENAQTIMIQNPAPTDWKDLQAGVCRVFREIGLHAEQDKVIKTPRGKVSLDVFAIDPGSVDSIQYVVECKNWKNSIPQSVVHSFTTVMHEVGANIGYIISKQRFQKGAIEYLTNTNIKGVTYADFQNHYLRIWIDRHFCSTIYNISDALVQYTEPINSRREKHKGNLSTKLQNRFKQLYDKYWLFGMAMLSISARVLEPDFFPPPDISIEKMNKIIVDTLGRNYVIETVYLREFLDKLVKLVQIITEQFNVIFGENIFAQKE
mgnify:CR=1 FL=1